MSDFHFDYPESARQDARDDQIWLSCNAAPFTDLAGATAQARYKLEQEKK